MWELIDGIQHLKGHGRRGMTRWLGLRGHNHRVTRCAHIQRFYRRNFYFWWGRRYSTKIRDNGPYICEFQKKIITKMNVIKQTSMYFDFSFPWERGSITRTKMSVTVPEGTESWLDLSSSPTFPAFQTIRKSQLCNWLWLLSLQYLVAKAELLIACNKLRKLVNTKHSLVVIPKRFDLVFPFFGNRCLPFLCRRQWLPLWRRHWLCCRWRHACRWRHIQRWRHYRWWRHALLFFLHCQYLCLFILLLFDAILLLYLGVF